VPDRPLVQDQLCLVDERLARHRRSLVREDIKAGRVSPGEILADCPGLNRRRDGGRSDINIR
jgi:hypothetical protein